MSTETLSNPSQGAASQSADSPAFSEPDRSAFADLGGPPRIEAEFAEAEEALSQRITRASMWSPGEART